MQLKLRDRLRTRRNEPAVRLPTIHEADLRRVLEAPEGPWTCHLCGSGGIGVAPAYLKGGGALQAMCLDCLGGLSQ